MVMGLYLATFLTSLAVSMTLLIRHRRVVTSTVLFSLLVTTGSYGRYLLAVSQTLETALLGNLFIYVGGCFCPLLLVLILVRLCNLRMPRWGVLGLVGISGLVFGLAMTIGHSSIYYRSVALVHRDGFAFLQKEYGPLHYLYPLLMAIYFAIMIYCMVYALRRYKEVSLRTILPIVTLASIVVGAYVLQRLTASDISYVSIGYLLAMIVFLRFMDVVNMYDMPTNIANCIEQRNDNGYIEFDAKFRCAGYNDLVRQLFPEIEEKWNVDDPVPADDSFLYREVVAWVLDPNRSETKTIQVGEKYYELFLREIPYGRKACVGYMLELIDRTADNRYMEKMRTYNDDLAKEVTEKTRDITRIRDMMVVGMASMVGSRDDSTGGHIRRTSQVMKVFARHLEPYAAALGVDSLFLEMVTRAAPMHDLGKIAVDDAILRKQGRFTPEEFDKMKAHSAAGARIVRNILEGVEEERFVTLAENVAHYHHEKWDGTGYPCGLKGEAIPLEARMMALADVLDALVSKRCYKDAMPMDEALAIIEESIGSHFDPQLGPIFLECGPELGCLYEAWNRQIFREDCYRQPQPDSCPNR